MDFLIATAAAQDAAQGSSGLVELLIMITIFFAIMYFLIIRPQQKRIKEHRALVASLAKGDEAVTQGGVLGRITAVGENFVKMEIANGTEIIVQKQAIGAVMPKGTMKDAI